MKEDKVIEYIVDWLKAYCDQAGMNGFVVGVSGGIDSAVAAGLAVRALGPDKVLGIMIEPTDWAGSEANSSPKAAKVAVLSRMLPAVSSAESSRACKSSTPTARGMTEAAQANTMPTSVLPRMTVQSDMGAASKRS